MFSFNFAAMFSSKLNDKADFSSPDKTYDEKFWITFSVVQFLILFILLCVLFKPSIFLWCVFIQSVFFTDNFIDVMIKYYICNITYPVLSPSCLFLIFFKRIFFFRCLFSISIIVSSEQHLMQKELDYLRKVFV